MRTQRFAWMIAAGALLVGVVGPAVSTVGPPVSVRMLGEPQPAAKGRTFEGIFEITAYAPGELTRFRLVGKGWSTTTLDVPGSLTLGKDDIHQIRFRAVPTDPNERLALEFYFNNRRVYWDFDLSDAGHVRSKRGGSLKSVPSIPRRARGSTGAPEMLAPPKSGKNNVSESAAQSTVRVRGQFVRARPDTVYPQEGVHGVYVTVSDVAVGFLEVSYEIGAGYTDEDGYFDILCSVMPNPFDPYPDISVVFSSHNSEVLMLRPTPGLLALPYSWPTDVYVDYAGSDLDVGSWIPTNEIDNMGLQVFSDVYRSWLYCYGNGYGPTGPVGIIWPHSDHSYYSPGDATIHIPLQDGWIAGTHVHEFGHHWMYTFAFSPEPDYCNGQCDVPACTHCLWCWEKDHVAWTEGFPDFMGYVIPASFTQEYGVPAVQGYNFEVLGFCSLADPTYHDPYYTEGFFAAVLQDICDDNDDNPVEDCDDIFGWRRCDTLEEGPDDIFWVATTMLPTMPLHFLQLLLDFRPGIKNDLWETAANCGYELDTEPPGIVGNLTSPTHPVSVESVDPYVVLTWTTADDDAAGIEGYSIDIGPSYGLPGPVWDIGAVESVTVGPLAGGTYYFNIRAQDRSWKWSPDYDWYGPIIIAPQTPADLEFENRPGWACEIVPRPAPDASYTYCPAPFTLYGNVNTTRWNVACKNSGIGATPDYFYISVYLDSHLLYSDGNGPLAGLTSMAIINGGPVTATGGRHTMWGSLNVPPIFHEVDHSNNYWGRQWVWTPYILSPNVTVVRSAPPDREGGWSSIPVGIQKWYNCDGLRFNPVGNWNAVCVHALDDNEDYNCRLHAASTGASNGFADYVSDSHAPAGQLDMVIVNGRTTVESAWDVGVTNSYEPGTSNYEAVHVTNGTLSIGDSLVVNLIQDQMLRLWEFQVGSGGPWPLHITVRSDPATPVVAFYLDETFTNDLSEVSAVASTRHTGYDAMLIPAAEEGYHCLGIYRDPKDGTGQVSVTVEIQPTPPDFQLYIPAGWDRSIVPRPAPDGTPTYAPLPDTLHGNIASTYYNISCDNDSPNDAPFLNAAICLDDEPGWTLSWGVFPAGGVSIYNWTYPHIVRGGRHTLEFSLDPDNEIEEISDSWQVWAEQFCWSPLEVPLGTSVTRMAPPDRVGGWLDMSDFFTRWYNCDGLRLPDDFGWWKGVAVMPRASSNVDVRLHRPLHGIFDGFAGNEVYSGWPTGESDYVLVNFNWEPWGAFDAGVLRIGDGLEDYTAHTVGAVTMPPWDGNETYGPYLMAENQILHLYEFYIPVGTAQFSLHNLAGSVDWGITLHPYDYTFLSKSDAVVDGTAWLAGPGFDETITVDITTADYYCLAVWKRNSDSLPLAGTYELWVNDTQTAVLDDGTPPARTALSAVYPNPFNPQTTIEYDLAARLPVTVVIFDAQGHRVRTLVDEVLPPARHVAVWDGRNDAGQLMASGVYFLRFSAGGVNSVKKLVLVK